MKSSRLIDDLSRVGLGLSLVTARIASNDKEKLLIKLGRFIKNNQHSIPTAAVRDVIRSKKIFSPANTSDSTASDQNMNSSPASAAASLFTPPEPLKPIFHAATSLVSGVAEVAGLMNSLSAAASETKLTESKFSPLENPISNPFQPNPIQTHHSPTSHSATPLLSSASNSNATSPTHSSYSSSSASTSASASSFIPISIPARQFVPRERSVPSTPIGRIFGFGSIAARLVTGTLMDGVKSFSGMGPSNPMKSSETINSSENRSSDNPSAHKTQTNGSQAGSNGSGRISFMSENNAERLAEGLCRMRGAALKVGQMLSIQDENLLPPQLQQVLDRVRDGADVMPRKQLEKALISELGMGWELRVKSFDWTPIAAASIGQVHKVELLDGRMAVMKVQYPGVAESINSDVNNVRMLIRYFNVLPKGLFIEETMAAAKEELAIECDYTHEARYQKLFKELFKSQPGIHVPDVIDDLSTKRILTSELVTGLPIDRIAVGSKFGISQQQRNSLAATLLEVCLKELFEYRVMQTDPNWSNFLYEPNTHQLNLIDFGATREYRKEFVDEYLRMVKACAEKDREKVIESSIKMGFLTGEESREMMNAHVEAAFIVGEPFHEPGEYDFVNTDMAGRVSQLASIMIKHRLTAPPKEAYTLHRKLSGCFLTCKKLGAVIPCREKFLNLYNNYKFEPVNEDGKKYEKLNVDMRI